MSDKIIGYACIFIQWVLVLKHPVWVLELYGNIIAFL